MSGEIELADCDICNQRKQVNRKYYRYPVKCECCNGPEDNHFEIVYHCNTCEPKPPRVIKAYVQPIEK